ncbi:DMSO/selenate family reductase complex A subunit [Mobilicoccus pelagius]|uniref:Biotin sulfoxide reductase n=1 Tax=Mobilicoccus pelagius NBRC 104925 TaxID=1089455 RepID=H5UMY1_9MICO|nr:DMSO/selenate family reductase complex A subunit [Mobilicoccus pelagius]GAB47089.1 biotin sulfoxide reductase [Mobilicoccus pelagius NBRC 104925]
MPPTALTTTEFSRRSLLRWSAVAGGGAALLGGCGTKEAPATPAPGAIPPKGRTVWSACVVNCGSRCPLRLQVQDGTVVRVLPDDTGDDSLLGRQIRACVRGRNMRQRIYNPDRIKKPLKRVGKRGEGKWQEISWEEAFDLFAKKLRYTIDTYGNEAIFKTYGSGVWNAHIAYSGGWKRLFNLLGGSLDYYGNYSYGQIGTCTKYHYGADDEQMSNSFEDAATNSRLLVLWGNNPQETRMSGGGNTFTSLWAHKRSDLRIVVVDPRYSDSASLLADEWIAPRPGTDAALVAGMAYVMVTENLHDQKFLDEYCSGFDEEHMPAGVPKGNSYKSYLLGEGKDRTKKTPAWASRITGVPEATIVKFARELATTKPANITQGWGPQRHANGENIARAIYTLAAMTGNVGIPGGGTGGREGYYWPVTQWFPDGDNPVEASISFYGWTDAIVRGPEMTATADGVRGVDKLSTGIKFMLSYGGNVLASQHGDVNRTKEIVSDESLCEFICVVDNQMTASAQLADLVLPDTTAAERWDLIPSEYTGDMAYLIMGEKAVEPLFDSKPAYDMCTEIAKRMGVEKEFTEGRTLEGWARHMQAETVKEHPDFPDFETLRKKGVHRYQNPDGLTVALKEFREDPKKNPLATPSGKIEIFSSDLWELAKTWTFRDPLPGDEITALPVHLDTWEGAVEARSNEKYPLQVIGHHFKGRTHSTYGNLAYNREAHPQKAWMNSLDAADRGIKNGDRILVFNDRGRLTVPVMVTPRIMPGVVSVPQGAWLERGPDGTDHGGVVNILTSQHPTPLSKGNAQHTVLAQVQLATDVPDGVGRPTPRAGSPV